MIILGIDTSTRRESAAVIENSKLICEIENRERYRPSTEILPLIDNLLDKTGIQMDDIHGFALAIGPGSFTGLRVGLAVCKGFALAKNRPIVGISTLKAMVRCHDLKGMVAPVMKANRKEVYAAVYESNKIESKEIVSDRSIMIDDFCGIIKTETFFLGDGAEEHKAIIREKLGERVVFHRKEPILNIAAGAAMLSRKLFKGGGFKDYNTLIPRYLKSSYAERI